MSTTIFSTSRAPQPIGPYNQAKWAGSHLYVSGQIALLPGTPELQGDNIKEQSRLALHNLKAILEDAGLAMSDLVKVTVFVTDMGQYTEFNEVYDQFIDKEWAPARELVQVSRLPADALVEISAIAFKSTEL